MPVNSRYHPSTTSSSTSLSWNPITWVLNGLDTVDPRLDKPISTTKHPSYWKVGVNELAPWKRPSSPPAQFYSRHSNRDVYRKFCPASRSYQWSTLREMLPPNEIESENGDDENAESADSTKPLSTSTYRKSRLMPSQCGGRHSLRYSPATK